MVLILYLKLNLLHIIKFQVINKKYTLLLYFNHLNTLFSDNTLFNIINLMNKFGILVDLNIFVNQQHKHYIKELKTRLNVNNLFIFY
jgi:hypothetical protein